VSELSHEKAQNLISKLIQGDKPGEAEMEKLVDHVCVCMICQQHIALVKQVLACGESVLNKAGRIDCQTCQEMLPEYVEQGAKACEQYPQVYAHLLLCHQCREEEETLSWILQQKEYIGPPPHVNAVLKEAASDQTTVIRLIRRARVWWDKEKSNFKDMAESFLDSTVRAAFVPIAASALTPSFLGPDEPEIEEIKYSLPEGLNLVLQVRFDENGFNLTAVPHLYELEQEPVDISLLKRENNGMVLIALDRIGNKPQTIFTNLEAGVYELHVEVGAGNRKRWEIPVEFGGFKTNDLAILK
jgi:hypothetical protein